MQKKIIMEKIENFSLTASWAIIKIIWPIYGLMGSFSKAFLPKYDKEKEEDFVVDIVYTWVDQTDALWLKKRRDEVSKIGEKAKNSFCLDYMRESEFVNLNQLKYSLRSVCRYAKFVRKIFIVTDDQVPGWLNLENEKIIIISHKSLFKNYKNLPCFNSHAIESRIHHIKGLSEHFLYFNDDFVLAKPVTKNNFFIDKNISKFFASPRVIDSRPCSINDLGISTAAKQGKILLQNYFNKTIRHHILHAPYPLKRSILFEMERKFPNEFSTTADHKFRHQKDHSFAAFLYFYYAEFTNRAVKGNIQYMYLDNSLNKFARKVFLTLFAKRYHTFCINEGHMDSKDNDKKIKVLSLFLKACFPVKCSFEA